MAMLRIRSASLFLVGVLIAVFASVAVGAAPAAAQQGGGATYTGTTSAGGTMTFTVSADGTHFESLQIQGLPFIQGTNCQLGFNVGEPGDPLTAGFNVSPSAIAGIQIVNRSIGPTAFVNQVGPDGILRTYTIRGSFGPGRAATGTLERSASSPSILTCTGSLTWNATRAPTYTGTTSAGGAMTFALSADGSHFVSLQIQGLPFIQGTTCQLGFNVGPAGPPPLTAGFNVPLSAIAGIQVVNGSIGPHSFVNQVGSDGFHRMYTIAGSLGRGRVATGTLERSTSSPTILTCTGSLTWTAYRGSLGLQVQSVRQIAGMILQQSFVTPERKARVSTACQSALGVSPTVRGDALEDCAERMSRVVSQTLQAPTLSTDQRKTLLGIQALLRDLLRDID